MDVAAPGVPGAPDPWDPPARGSGSSDEWRAPSAGAGRQAYVPDPATSAGVPDDRWSDDGWSDDGWAAPPAPRSSRSAAGGGQVFVPEPSASAGQSDGWAVSPRRAGRDDGWDAPDPAVAAGDRRRGGRSGDRWNVPDPARRRQVPPAAPTVAGGDIDPWGPPTGAPAAAPPVAAAPVPAAPGRARRPAPPAGGRRPAGARSGERPPARAPGGRTPAGTRAATRNGGLAPVYDVDGPRVRLGIAWFLVALGGLLAGPVATVVVYGAAAGLAGRHVVRAWRCVSWQADLAAGLAALPVLAALFGTVPAIAALALVPVAALVAASAPDGARLPGLQGRIAAAGIITSVVVPAAACAAVVLVRKESADAAVVLLLLVSAYEVGDFIVGSGASNFVEGPLAGATTAMVVGFPLTILLVSPFDLAGVQLLAFVAACCPLGQVMGSALLPRAGADAPALRRIDTLLLLAPLWVAAAAAL